MGEGVPRHGDVLPTARVLGVSAQKSSLIRWWIAVAVFVVAAAVLVVAGLWWNSSQRFEVSPAPAVEQEQPMLEAAEGGDGAPNVAAAVARTSKDPALGELSAQVTDLLTGEVVWNSNESRPLVPASATKIFTGSAALLALPSDHRVETYVVQSASTPGELILAGEGDVTLTKKRGEGFFTDAPSIDDLAAAVKPNLKGQKVTSIVVDNSVREGALFNRTWDRADVGGGNVADMDSVMLDAGRINTLQSDSPRSEQPGEDVAQALADALGASDAKVTVAEKTAATPMLSTTEGHANSQLAEGLTWMGAVESAPLDVRLRDMLVNSDNILAEAIGREVAESQGLPRTFQGATEATLKVLHEGGVDVADATLLDNSGMSTGNRLTSHDLDSALAHKDLRVLLDMLPVASAEGTLRTRYDEGSGAENSAGWVRAKTGTLSGVNALAGTVTTVEGRPLSFAFLSNDAPVAEGRAALDRLANSLRNAK